MGGDEEVVRFFDTDSLMCLCEFKAHGNRYILFFQFVVYMGTVSNVMCSSFIPQDMFL